MSLVHALTSKAAPAPAKPFAAFVVDNETKSAVLQAATDAGIQEAHVVEATFDDTLRRLRKIATPKLIVSDISKCDDPLADLSRLAEVCDQGTQVIAIGSQNDINLYRSLLEFGVEDYLVKPLEPVVMKNTLERVIRGPQTDGAPASVGRLICVIGVRGGVGATAVAVNTAWMLANEQKRRVALVDLDLFFGTCGLALDLDLGRGFREALENPSRIDGLFIERAMIRESDNLFVLSAEEALDYNINFDPSAIELLIDHLRRDFTHVIVDLPRFAARTQVSILTPPSSVALIAEPSLAGMRDTARLTATLKKIAPNTEVTTILNRVGANPACELDRAAFEKGAELKIDHVIPFDPKVFAASTATGKPLSKCNVRGKSIEAMRALAHLLEGAQPAKSQAGSWKRWLKGVK